MRTLSAWDKIGIGIGVFVLAVILWCLWCAIVEKPTTGQSAKTSAGQSPFLVAKPSGHQIVPYILVPSKSHNLKGWRYVVLASHPSWQQLIDLALKLHSEYPSSPFQIVDSTSGLEDLDAISDNPGLPEPVEFEKQHCLAIINLFVLPLPPRWEVIGDDAMPTSKGRLEALLEDPRSSIQWNGNASESELRVGASIVRVGDRVDEVGPVLHDYEFGTPQAEPDPGKPQPGNLIIRHFYRLNGKSYRIEYRIRGDSGPYRVFAILGQR